MNAKLDKHIFFTVGN